MELRPIINRKDNDRIKLIALILGTVGFIIGLIFFGLYLTRIFLK